MKRTPPPADLSTGTRRSHRYAAAAALAALGVLWCPAGCRFSVERPTRPDGEDVAAGADVPVRSDVADGDAPGDIVVTCTGSVANCDGLAANGCETDTDNDVNHCGGCGRVCMIPNAMPACVRGQCERAGCAAGWDDCNGAQTDGCEANLAVPDHCGSCINACPARHNATRTCSTGACSFACVAAFGDCNGAASDGCEQALTGFPYCGTDCVRSPCARGATEFACEPVTFRCRTPVCRPGCLNTNGVDSDGCEDPDGTGRDACVN